MSALAQLSFRRWVLVLCAAILPGSVAMAAQSLDARASSAPARAVPVERRQILILDSFQYGMPVADSINRGILTALTEGGVSINDIFVEHLDLVREPGGEHWTNEVNLLRYKLADNRIGIIVVEGSLATDFMAREGKDLFPDAALLTLLNTGGRLRGGSRMVMDMSERADLAGTLRVALDLFPRTRRVFMVTGGRGNIYPFLDKARQEFAPWTNKLDFEYTSEMTYEQMLRRVYTLPPNSIIIYTPYFTDASGQSFVPVDVLGKIRQAGTAPVFATLEVYLGRGIIGGSLVRTEIIGQQAGKVALDYLNGRIQLVEPVTTYNTPAVMMFDWRELARWKADTARLPDDSLFINRPVTLWGQFRNEVITMAAVFLALSGLVVALLILNYRLKRMEAAASESEARFRVMVERAPEAIIVYDIDLQRIIDANAKAEKLFGCNREKLLRAGPEQFYPPHQPDGEDVAGSVNNHNLRAMAGEEVVFEQIVHGDDGRDVTCEVRLVRLPYRQQRLVRGSYIDITGRKRAEDYIRQQAALLQETHDAIIVWDVERGLQYMNSAAEELTGLKLDGVLGASLPEVLQLRSELALRAALQEVTEHGTWTGVLTLCTAEGKQCDLDSRWSMLLDASGKPKAVLITCNDITEKKRLEAQYLRAQRLESVGTLASGIAHDLNNVLSPIIMGVDVLNETFQDPETREILASMQDSASRGRETVKQLLTFARGTESQQGPVQPRHLVKEIVRLVEQTFPKNIQIYTDYAQEPVTVLADPSQLHQVLMNLCVNARDAMPDGGVLFITLENKTLDEASVNIHPKARLIPYLVFKISDNGVGIPPEILDRIFDPFFTTKPQGKGTGLGLASVLGIVEGHRGFVLVESQPGRGTNFQVYIPATAPAEKGGEAIAVPEIPRGHGELVLVVDDEPAILRTADNVLRHHGYLTLTASGASEAVHLYEQNRDRIRAVLTDIMMPFGDGRQFITLLCEQDPTLPIIAMSGLVTEEFQRETMKRGARAFLRKPFNAEQLLNVLSSALKSKPG